VIIASTATPKSVTAPVTRACVADAVMD